MKVYYNNSEETAELIVDGWFHTGDIGEMDSQGYLKVIDRKKRILVLSTGMNVPPAPVESTINESAYIEQSMVLGDNRRYVICLINPSYENLIPWAKRNGIRSESNQEICRHKIVIDLLEEEVRRLTASLTNYSKIGRASCRERVLR